MGFFLVKIVGGMSEFVATRSAIVVDRDLPIGLAANAAAVLALSLGAMHPDLPGPAFVDGGGESHPGLFRSGLPILKGKRTEIARARTAAREEDGVVVIDMPAVGQTTNDYERFRGLVAATGSAEIAYAGIAVHGPGPVVRDLTKRFSLLR